VTSEKSPPKPALALRVGVTGHRRSRLDAGQNERIGAQIAAVLAAVGRGLDKAKALYSADYADVEPIRYFVSALADGADTLAAQQALTAGWRLLAPLPFARESYADDFSDADRREFESLLSRATAVAELDGARGSSMLEENAYLQAGVVTVDQSDFLIAVWDGEEARGPGGTAMIKEEALAAGKPVVWINAHADKPPVFLLPENLENPFTDEAVHEAVAACVAPPSSKEIEHAFSGKKTHALDAYRAYAEERAHRFNFGSFHQFWEKLFARKWPFPVRLACPTPAQQIATSRKSTLAQRLQSSEYDQRVFNDLIIPRFEWADHLAVHYSNLYRSSYFFNYLFAALAVLLALVDLVLKDYGIGSKTVWISIEVTLIFLILVITTLGKRGRWHEKWIDYRQLAEELRQYRLSFLTLGRGPGADLSEGEGAEAAGWVDWYLAASRREAGMTSGAFKTGSIRTMAQTVLAEEIRPQIAYHDRKAGELHKIEHNLHIAGEYAFGATFLICILYLVLAYVAGGDADLAKWAKYAKEDVKGVVTMLTGVLPALGAAFFGIRVQGEFGSTAERSHATAAQLKTIAAKVEALAAAETPRLATLRERIDEAARAMLMENMDWRMLYISKPLNLPG